MRHLTLFLFLAATFAFVGLPPTLAQDGPKPTDAGHKAPPEDGRPNLLAELNLSADQVRQIRTMNQARRQSMMEARRRMGEASRNLDMAVYGDQLVTDAEFKARLQEFQAAEAEIARLRFEGELSVRKVLTPEQLVRFRELRRQFADARRNENFRNRRLERRGQGRPPGRDMPPKRPLN